MDGLVGEGLVLSVGVSNFDRAQIEQCLAVAHVDALQPHFSMLHRPDADLIAWCGMRGVGVLTYGSLGFGLLTGAIGLETTFAETDWRAGSMSIAFRGVDYYADLFAPEQRERNLAVVDGLRGVAERIGLTVGQLALAWTFHQPGVTSAIVGSLNARHVRENAAAGDVALGPAILEEIAALLAPGPAR
jgi:aryl-alcohol dehydrogenase-like predicted oxidoreductase